MTRFFALAWLGFIAVISLMPLKYKDRVGTIGRMHNPGHFLVFFVASVLFCRAAASGRQRLIRCLQVCLFGVLTEVLEWVVYHNSLEWHDMFVDFAGAFLGAAVVTFWLNRNTRVAQQQSL